MRLLIGTFVVFALCGCSLGLSNRHSVAEAKIAAPSMFAGEKAKRPLYIVMSAVLVPDTLVARDGYQDHEISGVRALLSRELPAAMRPYFRQVEVVDSKAQLPSEFHWVGIVRVDRIRLSAGSAEVEWSYAVRRSDHPKAVAFVRDGSRKSGRGSVEDRVRGSFQQAFESLHEMWESGRTHGRFLEIEKSWNKTN